MYPCKLIETCICVCVCICMYISICVCIHVSIHFLPCLLSVFPSYLSFLFLPTYLPNHTDLNLRQDKDLFLLNPNELQSCTLSWWLSFPLTVAREHSRCTCVTLTYGDKAALIRLHLPVCSCFSLRVLFSSCSHSNRTLFSFC